MKRTQKIIWELGPDVDRAQGLFVTIDPKRDTPVDKLVALGRRLGASSTPTWFVESGERYSGALPFDEVRKILDAASPPRR